MKKSISFRLALSAVALAVCFFAVNVYSAPGDLYVATTDDTGAGGGAAIFKFTPAGVKTTFASGLTFPTALAFDRGGNLYVVEHYGETILKFTPEGTKSTFASGLSSPHGLAFDGEGNLFVTESFGDTGGITQITPAGKKSVFAYGGNYFSLAFDALGNLFAASAGPLEPPLITEFTPAGQRSNFAQFVTGDLAFGGAGNLFVADYDRIDKFTPKGYQTVFASNLPEMEGSAFDGAGNLFVTASYAGQIFKFNPNAIKSVFASGLTQPGALAFEPLVEKLRNISARGMVETGEGALIGGFVVGGNAVATNAVVIRAIGPSLAKVGVQNALQDPTLELHDASGSVLATNDNWQDTQKAQITATGLAPSDPHESAIAATLPAGSYTAVVRGAGNTTGVALVEVYSVDK